MAVRKIRRQSGVANFKAAGSSNDITVDSATDELKFGTGSSGTTARIVPKNIVVMWNIVANGSLVDQCIFIATRAYTVKAVSEVHSTLGTDGSAVNLQLTKDTGTTAPAGGTALLTNNANAGFDMKAAINTVQVGTLTATAASLALAAGDRLSLDFVGTLTALAGVVVTIELEPA